MYNIYIYIYIYYVLSVELHMEAKSLVVCARQLRQKRRNRKTRVITTQDIDLSYISHLYVSLLFLHREKRDSLHLSCFPLGKNPSFFYKREAYYEQAQRA